MQRFTEYLTEEPQWTMKVIQRVQDSKGDSYLPLTTPMLQRLLKFIPRKVAFHVLGYDNLKNLARLQGTQKAISAATKVTQGFFERGIWGGGGFCAKIEGQVLTHANRDIMSTLDDNGRRWVSAKFMADISSPVYEYHGTWIKLMKGLWGVRFDMMERFGYLFDYSVSQSVRDGESLRFTNDWFMFVQELYDYMKMNNQTAVLSQFIKQYFDGCEKMLSSVSPKELADALGFTKPVGVEHGITTYDEILMTDIHVKELFISASIDGRMYHEQRDKVTAEMRGIFGSQLKVVIQDPYNETKDSALRKFMEI